MKQQKRAVIINDISGMGKCSVSVACPIISSTGIETAILPTALLSTHTGGFSKYTFLDLTDEMTKISKHWEKLNIKFDAIYSGYLGSMTQIDIVNNFIDKFKKENTLVVVDPVMGDAGKFYAGFSNDYLEGMRKLCSKADIIIPNLTEALFLLGQDYTDGPYTEDYIYNVIKNVSGLGCKNVILTGVHFNNLDVGSASYDRENDEYGVFLAPRIEGFYHGTGDVFASVLISAVLNGKSLSEANKIAVNFTENAIIRTKNAGTDTRFGVNFEEGISDLLKELGL